MDLEKILTVVITAAVSAAFGFVSSQAVFKAKFAVMDAQRLSDLDSIEKNRQHDKELAARDLQSLRDIMGRVERINRATLEIVANIARQSGLANRAVGVDALAELLSHEIPDAKKD